MKLPPLITKKKIILAMACLFAVGTSYLGYYSLLKIELSWKTSKIQKDGYPATPEELEKWYPEPPSGKNAACLYIKAAESYKRNPADEQHPRISSGRVEIPIQVAFTEEIMKNTECYLKANQETLELLHKAAGFRDCRFPVEVSDPDRPLAYLSNLRQDARLLAEEAVFAAEKGDSVKAFKAVLDSIALSSSLEKEATIDSFLTMMDIEHIALCNLERILSKCNFDAEQCKQLSGKLAGLDEMKSIERALAGERTYILAGHSLEEYLEYIDYNYPSVRKNKTLKKSVEFMSDFLLLWMLNELASVDFVSELIEACKEGPESVLMKTGAMQDRIRKFPSSLFAAKSYLPTLFPALDKKAMAIAEVRVARVGLAVVSYRHKNGRMPENSAELIPEFIDFISVDPMDAKPLRYKKTEKCVLVYSVGADGVDDEGNPGLNNGFSKGEDVVLRISTEMPDMSKTR